jgi:hypothetical protein
MRQEYRTLKSVASHPCDWLLLLLTMRAQGASLTKTDGKIDESLTLSSQEPRDRHNLDHAFQRNSGVL